MIRVVFRHDLGGQWSHLIARMTGAPVHCGFFLDGDYYEANTPKGFTVERNCDGAFMQDGQWTVFVLPAHYDVDMPALRAWADAQVGSKYDYVGVLFAWWAGRYVCGSTSRWFCSEAVARCLQLAGVALSRPRASHFTPRRLYSDVCIKMWGNA